MFSKSFLFSIKMCLCVFIREMESFMRKHSSEKSELMQRISQQAQTIHQLSHHVQLLQSLQEQQQVGADTDAPVPENADKFGGKYPLFFKDGNVSLGQSELVGNLSRSHDQTSSRNQTASGVCYTGNRFVSEPWPISDPLHKSHISYKTDNQSMNQQQTLNDSGMVVSASHVSSARVVNAQSSQQRQDKSFVSRMTDGIQDTSNSLAHQLDTSDGAPMRQQYQPQQRKHQEESPNRYSSTMPMTTPHYTYSEDRRGTIMSAGRTAQVSTPDL
jgi:hypothetical protein